MQGQQEGSNRRQAAWRRRFGLAAVRSSAGGLESAVDAPTAAQAPADRIARARAEMERIVVDRLGGDAALMDRVRQLAITAAEALDILEGAEREPLPAQYSSLEAIVAFDGTRPSFLIRNGEVDLDSSYSTSEWKVTLSSKAEKLADFAACVGRVEIGTKLIGSAFLVTPTLAATNRHVAQGIAAFADDGGIALKDDVWIDFGREHPALASWDRRKVRRVVFAGARPIREPVDHTKLDLALIEVDESQLGGTARHRRLAVSEDLAQVPGGELVIATGYPADWHAYVPANFRGEYEQVLARLLEGEQGAKRLAPGMSGEMLPADAAALTRTATHDATTINGNSGSPLALLDSTGRLRLAGLHYGGQWGGERTNWAHVLGACMRSPGIGAADLRSALQQHGALG